MKYLKFKTNIKCGGCIAKVAPALNEEKKILKWQVDTTSPDRILSIETEHLNAQEITSIIAKAGFQAEPLIN
ncbi:MAG TPA: heavy-metal-associated domain-containing protein [Bacteroidia bacterium]|jgi:copper chaperone|nr:heavy-metal-associated domain-containing protein [Bacteroidia bacterium]